MNYESDNSIFLNNLGFVLLKLNDFDNANKYFDKSLSVNSKNEYAWFNKAFALNSYNDYEDIIHCFKMFFNSNSIKNKYLDNFISDNVYNIGRLLFFNDFYKESIECYNFSLEVNPYDYSYWNDKAISLERINLFNDALNCYEKALELNPNDESIIENKDNLINLIKIKEKFNFKNDEIVKIISGPFKGQNAVIIEIDFEYEELILRLIDSKSPIPLTINMNDVEKI